MTPPGDTRQLRPRLHRQMDEPVLGVIMFLILQAVGEIIYLLLDIRDALDAPALEPGVEL